MSGMGCRRERVKKGLAFTNRKKPVNIVTYRKELVYANIEVAFFNLMAVWIENEESKGVTAVTDFSFH